ncbi:unnamed protein product [Lactuca virosa]|uniref:Uncharacterized protein n=1 Tax=Lactuca virosa TaxID=75947 RepID=A0AAU9NLE3_9ASTR|nr:unnamed protein product [Lactuca virosa]
MSNHFLRGCGPRFYLRKGKIGKACGAVIVNRPDELQESDVGTGAGLFEVKKIGDEFFAYIVDCQDPKACTTLLRGARKDLLNQVERILQEEKSKFEDRTIDGTELKEGGGNGTNGRRQRQNWQTEAKMELADRGGDDNCGRRR